MSASLRRSFANCVAAFFLSVALTAQSADSGTVWLVRSWQSIDGLQDDSVVGVAQTPDGYLWVATAGGLLRFDGMQFQQLRLETIEGVPNRVVRAMTCDRHGRLWLGMDRGPIVCISPDSTQVFTNVPDARASVIAEDGQGTIWETSTEGGLTQIANGRVTVMGPESGWPAQGASSLATDADGCLWFAKGNRVGIYRDGKFQTLFTLPDNISCIGQRSVGGVWICTPRLLLEATRDGSEKTIAQFPPAVARGGGGPQTLLEDRAGAIWIGTVANGLFRVSGTIVEAIPSSYFDVDCLSEDREGNIWAGTDGGGLERLRPRIIELLGRESGLPNVSVRTTCQDADGTIWVTTQNGLIARRRNGGWETLEKGTNSVNGFVSCVAAATGGGIWIGTTDNGFFYWNAGRSRHWNRQNGLTSDDIRAILQSSNGDVFISSDGPSRLHRLRDGRLQPLRIPVSHRSLRAMVEDVKGDVWVASADGVLMRIDGNSVLDETPPSKRPLSIRCLSATPDGSVWIGYAAWGIGRLKDGKFVRITSDNGLYDDYVSQMVADDDGWLWCAGNRGVFRVSLAQLNDVADGRSKGLRSIAYPAEGANLQPNYENGSTAFRSSDGHLYFPMRNGLAFVHIENVPHGLPPPPVIIERVAVDDRTVALYDRRLGLNLPDPMPLSLGQGTPSSLRFSPNHRTLDFEFTALSFASPEDVQFEYRLQNFEDDWKEIGIQREVHFERLSPGSYRFDVRACNSDGVWSPEVASANFVVTPFFWQTWWFRSAALLAFTLSVIAIVRYVSFRRLRRQLIVLEQQATLQRERTRIAKDIHDDLGANLTQIAFLGELAHQDRGEPDKTADRVEKISATARQAIKSLDEIVWAVNPRNDTLAHLIDYSGQFALDYLRLAGIRCRLDFPEQCPPRELSTDLRHNLFLVIKEALHNIVKHARASEVRLRIQFSGDTLDINIEDNGCGFDPALARNGDASDPQADGLRNMRQRMSDIGGEFEFRSSAGMGTTVHLHLPLERESV